jgi:hypothetical protein
MHPIHSKATHMQSRQTETEGKYSFLLSFALDDE